MVTQPDPIRPKVGLSACLSGQPVRYDGRDKYAPVCMEVIGRYVEWVPICPEVAIGLGIPRPPIDLVQDGGAIRAVNRPDPSLDPTAALEAYAEQVGDAFPELCAYVFMSRSPSCALHSGRLYRAEDGELLSMSAPGRYAERWCTAHPNLPVIEAEDLDSNLAQAAFLCRVYLAYACSHAPSPSAQPTLNALLHALFPQHPETTIDEPQTLLRTIDISNGRVIISALGDLQARLIHAPATGRELPAFIHELLETVPARPASERGGL